MAFTFVINGHTYTSDPAVSVLDGYRFNGYGYIKALGNLAVDSVAVAGQAKDYRDSAAAYAQTALLAPGTQANSTSSVALPGAGSLPANLAFTIEPGKALIAGMTLKAVAVGAIDNYAIGDIQSYNAATGALVLRAQFVSGAGTFASWALALSATPFSTVANSVIAKSATDTMLSTHKGQLISATGTWALNYSTAAQLGNGWYCYVFNDGTGNITQTPSAGETMDGRSSFVMYPGEARLVVCDGTTLRSIVLRPFRITAAVSGSFAKPPGYSYFWVRGLGGGSGGGGGGGGGAGSPPSSAGNYGYGGSGGSGGAGGSSGRVAEKFFADASMPSSVSYVIGANGVGGNGGAGSPGRTVWSDSGVGADGNSGTSGGDTTFGTSSTTCYLVAPGGSGASTGGNGGRNGTSSTNDTTNSTQLATVKSNPSAGSVDYQPDGVLVSRSAVGSNGLVGSSIQQGTPASTTGGVGGTTSLSLVAISTLPGGNGGAIQSTANAAGNNGSTGSAATVAGAAGAGGGGGSGSAGSAYTAGPTAKAGDGGKGGDGQPGQLEIVGII